MTIPVSARQGYALWANEWDASDSPIVALEQRVLAPWIAELSPRRAIDVGCGTGRWTAPLRAIGVDVSPEMLLVAASKGLCGRLAVGDAAALPLANGSAGAVICTLTLGHVRAWQAAMKELARVLETRGHLILTDFHPQAAQCGWRRTFRHRGSVYELENHAYTVDELRTAAPELVLDDCIEAPFGEPERAVFQAAGRLDLFEAASGRPAVLATRWTRA